MEDEDSSNIKTSFFTCELLNRVPLIEKSDFTMDDSNVLGEGSFGKVVVGEWLGTKVAVKQLSVQLEGHQNGLLMKNEIDIHSKMRHPNIVQLMGVCCTSDAAFILTELVEGADLSAVIFGEWNHPIDKNNILCQLCRAVAYLHGNGVIHQDIKPGNILLDNSGVLKLCDFGLSNYTESETANKTLRGTVGFMAPEMLLNGEISVASDMWAFGCTAYELCAGEFIWDVPNDLDSYEHILNQFWKGHIPPGLSVLESHDMPSLLIRCFRRKPNKRPSALELLAQF